MVSKALKKRIVIHIHGSCFQRFYIEHGHYLQHLIQWFLSQCDRVVVLSQVWQRFFSREMPKVNTRVIENGIDLPDLKESVKKTKIPSLLYVGELSQRKGIPDLFATAARLKQHWERFTIYIMGPGNRALVQHYAADQGLNGEIEYIGICQGREKWEYFQKAWCFFLPSYAEGFPIVLLEAMAAGLPVVTTPVGGIPDMVISEKNGYLVSPGDIQGFEKKITQVWQDSSYREFASEHNKQYIIQYYTIDHCVQKIMQMYRQLLPLQK